jgi:hypothetical protein
VFVSRIDFANMDLTQAGAKLLEHLIRLNHGSIDLSRVTDIEA